MRFRILLKVIFYIAATFYWLFVVFAFLWVSASYGLMGMPSEFYLYHTIENTLYTMYRYFTDEFIHDMTQFTWVGRRIWLVLAPGILYFLGRSIYRHYSR